MFFPVLLFAAAGALIGAGVGGVSLWGTARRKAAEQEMRETNNLREEALKARMRLKDVEDQAAAMGLDPAAVLAGIDALVEGQVSATAITGALAVPGPATNN